MPDEALVKNIKVIKNNIKRIQDTFFPNIDYREQVLQRKDIKMRHTMLQSYIPIIREDVYLVLLVHRWEEDEVIPNRKKEYIQKFLQEANMIQQRYIVNETLVSVEDFGQPLIYKMEY